MRTEDVLATIGTGLWRWDNASGAVTLDGVAARLLGLPAVSVTLSESAGRARFHPVDWVEVSGIVNLALAEDSLAEARLRVVDEDGTVLRTVRSRARPVAHGERLEMVGTLEEVPEPMAGTAVATPITGDWRRNREAFLLDAGRALAEAQSSAEVLRVAAGLSMPGFTPDGLAVFGVEGNRIMVLGHQGYEEGDEEPFMDMTLETDYPAAEAVRTGRAIYIPSPEEYRRRFPTAWPLTKPFGRRSWAYLPLIVAGRTIGAWMGAFSQPVSFTPDERAVLTTIARMFAQALSRTSLHDTERALADGLQRTMLPDRNPDVPGLTIAARYVPTGGGLQVGGDWYDVIPLPSGRTALVIGDVQGHDVRAAGLMGQLRIALRAYATEGHHPDAVLSRASRFFASLTDIGGRDGGEAPETPETPEAGEDGGESDPRFATCLYMEIDPATGTLDVARAGHPDLAIAHGDGTVLVRPTAGGLPLGIVPDADYPTTRLTLEPDETLLVCTDGLIETGGHDLETGWERIRAIFGEHLRALSGAPPSATGTPPSATGAAGTGTGTGTGTEAHGTAAPTGPDAEPWLRSRKDLNALADALLQAVHGPPSHYRTGPLADRREDDIAFVLISRGLMAPEAAGPRRRRAAITVAQAQPQRIAEARQQLRDMLHDWTSQDQAESAVLMLSEMVTNVLVHTDGDALVIAEISGGIGARRLRLDVADASDELPHRRHPGELASSGRGLLLMEMLAGSWGVDPRGEGKCIWFELYEPSRAAGHNGATDRTEMDLTEEHGAARPAEQGGGSAEFAEEHGAAETSTADNSAEENSTAEHSAEENSLVPDSRYGPESAAEPPGPEAPEPGSAEPSARS
ncbi:SpoIIE family protein phosphatase [Streptomyces zagrosensis]|uniref:Anti-sigma regulatory factor (Ser/Thr protein kinase) n=1 Tax=Streptomyces zagrosensis TaxID=1042984 RepID=A0A7W9Q781_9ACTN|nr:SpoIIE family protein phosphatase [Streptomyces zagrosensis]MBB5934002.1 anti-sigma regulatory factor (Ser/Thr protein kinase) [Streptomyces zagrosensis]